MTITALAQMPTRATTSFTLAWGLVSIPVSAYTGTEATRVTRSEYIKVGDTLIAVGRSPIRKDTGEVVEPGDVLRYATADNGELVVLNDAEIEACTSPKGVGEILSFVPVKEVNEYLAENVYQVRPKSEKGKENPAAAKAFALLLTAMRKQKVVALVKVALRGPARYGLLDAEGNFTLIYTADAIREARPITEYTFSKAELDLASQLVAAAGVEAIVITDETAPMVQEYVNSKATGKVTKPVEAPAPTIDLAAALMASVEAAKASKGKVA